MRDMEKKLVELKKPFKPEEVEWMITATSQDKQQGLVVPFVSNRAVQNRLDEVFGIDGWRNEYKPWKESAQLCGISIYDDEKSEWITKWDGAADTDIEPVKGGLSAAMKRAAAMFGIGRYLYDIENTWVQIEPTNNGRSYRIARGCTPALPAWALPEGTKNTTAPAAAPQPQTPATTPPPSSGKKLTERQINRAYVKGRNAGKDEASVQNIAAKRYNKPLADLSYDKYEEFCRYLDTLAKL